MRESVVSSGKSLGYSFEYDVSLKPQDYYRCVEATRDAIKQAPNLSSEEKESVVTVGYGHVGDGNLHLNCSIPGYDNLDFQERIYDIVDPFVMEFVRDCKGSVSAEHGVGL